LHYKLRLRDWGTLLGMDLGTSGRERTICRTLSVKRLRTFSTALLDNPITSSRANCFADSPSTIWSSRIVLSRAKFGPDRFLRVRRLRRHNSFARACCSVERPFILFPSEPRDLESGEVSKTTGLFSLVRF